MTWNTDIQANILRGLPARRAEYRFLRFLDGDALQQFVRRVLPEVHDAAWQRDQFSPAMGSDKAVSDTGPMTHAVLNLAFTRPGIELVTGAESYQPDDQRRDQLDPDRVLLGATSDAFALRAVEDLANRPGGQDIDPAIQNSMYRRLDLLGEPTAEGETTWSADWLVQEPIHALAWISGPADDGNNNDPTGYLTNFVTDPAQAGVDVIQGLSLSARRDATGVDPFGWVDGVVQPAIQGFHTPREFLGRGAWTAGGWRGLAPGEFIVGERDEGNEQRFPRPGDILFNSTFLVFRQIEMWPDRLEDFLEERAEAHGVEKEALASWLMGRHRLANDNESTSLMTDGPAQDHDFIFGFDPEGVRCPLGAHIRRANPRDSLGKAGSRSNRHRIIRRGMPYFTADQRQGLAFIALQARIEDQFEFIQRHWLNSGPTLHVGEDPDPIAGVQAIDVDQPRFVKQGSPPTAIELPSSLDPAVSLTSVRGGEYFVMPSLPGLRSLAGL